MAAQTVSQAVEKRDAGPISIMWSRKRHFDAVLPASVDVEAFLGTAAGALYASPKLMEYASANPDSLVIALMECAALGHMPGTDEYYLTPRKDHGKPKILGIEGYRGVVERMYRSGAVAKVVVREVCADDPFDYVEGRDRVPLHEIGGRGGTGTAFFGANGGRKRGDMVGAYAYAELTTGAISRVVILTRDDIFAARDSGGYKPDDQFSPWNRLDSGPDNPEFIGRSMWWKTGAKRLEPWVPTSREYRAEMLRASASAAALAEPRREPLPDLPAVSGPDIVDAELVDEPQTPAAQTDSAAPPVTRPETAPARSRPARERLDDLGGAFTRLGIAEADQPAVLAWLVPDWTATASQIGRLAKTLGEYADAVPGDIEESRSRFWQAFKAQEAGDG